MHIKEKRAGKADVLSTIGMPTHQQPLQRACLAVRHALFEQFFLHFCGLTATGPTPQKARSGPHNVAEGMHVKNCPSTPPRGERLPTRHTRNHPIPIRQPNPLDRRLLDTLAPIARELSKFEKLLSKQNQITAGFVCGTFIITFRSFFRLCSEMAREGSQ